MGYMPLLEVRDRCNPVANKGEAAVAGSANAATQPPREESVCPIQGNTPNHVVAVSGNEGWVKTTGRNRVCHSKTSLSTHYSGAKRRTGLGSPLARVFAHSSRISRRTNLAPPKLSMTFEGMLELTKIYLGCRQSLHDETKHWNLATNSRAQLRPLRKSLLRFWKRV